MSQEIQLIHKQYPILGIWFNFISSSKKALRLVENRYGDWQSLPPEIIRADPPMTIMINELPNSDNRKPNEQIHFKIEKDFLSASGNGLDFHVDRQSGRAEVRIESKVLKLENFFKRDILGAIIRFLIFSKDRVPLHASTLIVNETALIIYGQSGSGKSTLSYQLLKRGAEILSESAVFIASEGSSRLWGDVQDIYLRPDAKEIFPELTNYPEKTHPNGKIKIQLPLPLFGKANQHRLYFDGPMFLIILDRSEDSESHLIEIAQKDVVKKLSAERESGFNLSEQFEETIHHLPVISTYLFKSGNDLSAKAKLLESLCQR